MIPLLAQQTGSGAAIFRMTIGLVIVLLLAAVLLAVLSIVRKRMRGDNIVARDFSLSDLRALHREGKLTDDEFERAKANLVGAVQSKLAKEAKPPMTPKPLGEEPKKL